MTQVLEGSDETILQTSVQQVVCISFSVFNAVPVHETAVHETSVRAAPRLRDDRVA